MTVEELDAEELDAALIEGQREVERCELEIKALKKALEGVEGTRTEEDAKDMARVKAAQEELRSLLTEQVNMGMARKIHPLSKEIEVLEASLLLLHDYDTIHQKLVQQKDTASEGRWAHAIEQLIDIRQAVKLWNAKGAKTDKVLNIELRERELLAHDFVEAAITNSIFLSTSTMTISGTKKLAVAGKGGGAKDIGMLLSLLYQLEAGGGEEVVEEILESISIHMLFPWLDKFDGTAGELRLSDVKNGGLSLAPIAGGQEGERDAPETARILFSSLGSFFELLYKVLCNADARIISTCGDFFFGRGKVDGAHGGSDPSQTLCNNSNSCNDDSSSDSISNHRDLIDSLCQTVLRLLPEDPSELGSFSVAIEESVRIWLERLKEFGYLRPLADGEVPCTVATRLAELVKQFPIAQIEKKSFNFLDRARNLMKMGEKDYFKALEGVDEITSLLMEQPQTEEEKEGVYSTKPLAFPPCQLSCGCTELVKLFKEVVEEGYRGDEEYGRGMVSTGKDILDMYMVMMPKLHGNLLGGVPTIAAVFWNDCRYLAHASLILTMGGGRLWSKCMLSTAPLLRDLGSSTFTSVLHKQEEQLLQFLDEMFPSSSSLNSPADPSPLFPLRQAPTPTQKPRLSCPCVNESIRRVLYQLQQLEAVWGRGVLPSELYDHVMRNLVERVVDVLIEAVVIAQEPPRDGGWKGLWQSFDMMVKGVPKLWGGEEGKPSGKVWRRFIELVGILQITRDQAHLETLLMTF